MTSKIIAIATVSTLLTACGGGGNGGETSSATSPSSLQSKSIQGVAIDGYISGATAFLDLNYNGELDSGEPKSITDANGRYELSLSGENADCIDYAPIVVDVPVGAIDADNPNTPIEEAYQLFFPPVKMTTSGSEVKSTTPLTSMLWNVMKLNLDIDDNAMGSCADLKLAIQLQGITDNSIQELENDVANRNNVSVDQLYSDFIKEDDNEVKALTQKLMPVIKASYRESKMLKQQNPKAEEAYVSYIVRSDEDTNDDQNDQWYKVQVTKSGSKVERRTFDVTSELVDPQLIEHVVTYTAENSDLSYTREYSLRRETEGNQESIENLPFNCSIKQTIEETHKLYANSWLYYVVTNQSATKQESEMDVCLNYDVGRDDYEQTVEVMAVDNSQNQGTVIIGHRFHYDQYKANAAWVDVDPTLNNVNGNLLESFVHIDPDFRENEGYGSLFWVRSKAEFSSNESSQVITIKYSDDVWFKETDYDDGSTVYECSESEFGEWNVCGYQRAFANKYKVLNDDRLPVLKALATYSQ
ncbi:hypothetical protein L1D31_05525 [Vibrio sp. Isolate23]|uniref:hypothetical protein n=1 Tax=Vibrio sp. Isolate23 TaxID=2908533 RepID=UPI001EFEDC48|nr:hypothetical protein [Vibrio sp. Isolate23]MCG9682024.1 hypothetical protein [Vibrio sp. Isolate23]